MKRDFNINGNIYNFDFQKIMEFIEWSEKNKSSEREILDNYDDTETRISKSVREFTTKGDGNIDNIRYDLIKQFILQIITYGTYEEDEEEVLPLGMKIALSTMINNGFLKEVKLN